VSTKVLTSCSIRDGATGHRGRKARSCASATNRCKAYRAAAGLGTVVRRHPHPRPVTVARFRRQDSRHRHCSRFHQADRNTGQPPGHGRQRRVPSVGSICADRAGRPWLARRLLSSLQALARKAATSAQDLVLRCVQTGVWFRSFAPCERTHVHALVRQLRRCCQDQGHGSIRGSG
jgi:hypothetical protein